MTEQHSATYLGLGSNLGNREANLRMALNRLTPLVHVDAVSALYETAPVGEEDQPPFLNAVARVTTGLTPPALLRYLKALEEEIGRRPGPRWGPRPIDIDILLMGDRILDTPDLTLPHPRIGERAFVLVPLAELAPDVVLPGGPDTIAKLAERIDATGVTPVADAGWERRGRGWWLEARGQT